MTLKRGDKKGCAKHCHVIFKICQEYIKVKMSGRVFDFLTPRFRMSYNVNNCLTPKMTCPSTGIDFCERATVEEPPKTTQRQICETCEQKRQSSCQELSDRRITNLIKLVENCLINN